MLDTEKPRCPQSGVTFIEVLVAVAVIGILASVALPSFTSSIQKNRLRLLVDTVVTDLREARTLSRSAGPGNSIGLEIINPGVSWSYEVSHSRSGVLRAREADDFEGAHALSVTSLDFADKDSDGNRDIRFTFLNTIDADGAGTLVLSMSAMEVRVTRNLVGLVSVCATSAELGYPSCGN